MILQELIKTLGSSQVLRINVIIVNPITEEEINITVSDIDLTGNDANSVSEDMYSLRSFCTHARKLGLQVTSRYELVDQEFKSLNQ